jgi:acetate kinase
MRAIHQRAESGDQSAQLALAMYAYRIKKYTGAYFAVLGQVDALVFTGGIGENDAWLREQCCENMGLFGIALDSENNQSPDRPTGLISQTNSKVAVLVIATDEELEIALQADQCLTSIDS